MATSPISEAMVAVMVRTGEKRAQAVEHDRGITGDHHDSHGLTQGAADSEHHGGQHSASGGGQGDAPDGFPAAGTEGVSGFAVGGGDCVKRIFGDGNDGGNGDECQ